MIKIKTLNIFVCKNFAPEFEKSLKNEGFSDVVIKPFPFMCMNKRKKKDTKELLNNNTANEDYNIILCGKNCDILKLIPENSSFEIRTSNFCFNHLANENLINYIISKGGYIISSGYLNNWKENIKSAGFDKETARLFFKDFCDELIFFDAGIDQEAEKKLSEFSKFLGLPYVIIPFELETLITWLRSIVYEWKLQKKNQEFKESVTKLQAQCAEYSTVFDLIGKIATYRNKRDTIEKIKEIFVMVFGAQEVVYWDINLDYNDMSDEAKELATNSNKSYLLFKKENRFCIKIQHKNIVYGLMDVSNFLFPQYTEKYLNLAIETINICGLVLSNIEQYETLQQYTKELKVKNRELETANNKIDNDFNKANLLHNKLMPESFPNIHHLSIAPYFKPSDYLGGDLYGVHEINNNRVLFYVVDVLGHGIDGSLLSIFVRENINNYLLIHQKQLNSLEPHTVLNYIKDRLFQENFPEEYFICMQVGIIDTLTQKASFANAGIQIYPVFVNEKGQTQDIKIEGLPISKTIPFETYDYNSCEVSYKPGSLMFLTTDGLIEEEKNGTCYDLNRSKNILSSNNNLPPEVISDIINDDFYSFAKTNKFQDDVTYLIVKTDQVIDYKNLKIKSTKESTSETSEKIKQIIQKYLENSEFFLMALYEMLINAVEHGNKFAPEKEVEIDLRVTQEYVYASIKDQGEGFNWKKGIKKDFDIQNLEERGRGIIITKMFLDCLSYNIRGNQVRLVKFR